MNDILSGLPGVLCHVDDILVFGATPSEHDGRLRAVFERIKDAGVTLNAEKCQSLKPESSFLAMSLTTMVFHQTHKRQRLSRQ